ncbi:MAG: hypothetical protein ABSF65_00440 [Candidatus Bathyarchaeia archaeon]|jgi:hypothetical protein
MPKRKSNDPFGFGDFGFGSFDVGLGSNSKSVRSKRSNDSGIFGFDFGFGDLGAKKAVKSYTFENNKVRGKTAEGMTALNHTLQGHEVTRVHKGGDFIIKDRHGKTTIVEVKTGKAKLSEAQRKKKARLGNKRYKVERYY